MKRNLSSFFRSVCDNALPAAVFEALLVLPSRRTLDAADAALAEVCFVFFGILKSPFLDLSTTYNIMRDKSRKTRKIIPYIVSANKEGRR